jgi:hypothetical protein
MPAPTWSTSALSAPRAPFHHPYQNGTTSIFVAIGTIGPQPVFDNPASLTRPPGG